MRTSIVFKIGLVFPLLFSSLLAFAQDESEEDELLMLEEDWLVIENGEDDEASEAQYHLDCDAVTREADEKRVIAKSQKSERHSAIENLVAQCANHIEDHKPPPRASHAAEYLLAMAMLGALTYVML